MTRPLPFALAFALGLAACQPADTPVGPEASEAPTGHILRAAWPVLPEAASRKACRTRIFIR